MQGRERLPLWEGKSYTAEGRDRATLGDFHCRWLSAEHCRGLSAAGLPTHLRR